MNYSLLINIVWPQFVVVVYREDFPRLALMLLYNSGARSRRESAHEKAIT